MPRAERRLAATPAARIESRQVDGVDVSVLAGHAAVFDVWTTLYDANDFTWREVVRPGAFSRAIAEAQDVRALWNHDANFILGRTTSGTLKLREDEKGLWSETELLDTQTVRDLVVAPIRRGDVSGMSFAFVVANDGAEVRTRKEDGTVVVERTGERVTFRRDGDRMIEERELLRLDLYDVSPVVYPQYDGTDVYLRSADFNPRDRQQAARNLMEEIQSAVQTTPHDDRLDRVEMVLKLIRAGF
jgi:uncharacterized protein